MTTETIDTANWASGPLHAALVLALPIYVKEPFSASPRLNILDLKNALGNSHETVYKWLRTDRLTPKNARRLVEIANTAENVAALTKLGRTPPKREDFSQFYPA